LIELTTAVSQVSISPISMRILLPYITVALTGMITIFYHSTLKNRLGDAKGMWLYFCIFFALLAAVPILLILLIEGDALRVLIDLGVTVGNYKIGLVLAAVFVPISLLIGHVVSRTEEMIAWYPFSKQVCARDRSFALYEVGYVLLYYTAWEFLYRGLLFSPLLKGFGFVPAMAITTSLSTVHHIGHPKSEIVGAVLGGVIFSLIVLLTRSILYPIVIHAMIGVVNDTLIYLRNYRKSSGG
jgi:membrane protease YdiL (CAAX protease family)